ncbi:phenylalanine 4-monooxygenase [Thalassotalea sp. HSM 43]|uniref:phenylalanine 4-monooxygenase n=1 Tax=Thalassotalea sp. HSM 43 TaxID=2552945 RepID=UPI0010813BF3|nr:phenylalanine 4-monooxygenase [Thalassotalea sp. HSM 43]QBY05312.1 phenylalanine 4-monooxygenase [Thalassotalea sp. HSM 43]
MSKSTSYVSKQGDENGFIDWTEQENASWEKLYKRQLECIKGKACDEFILGLEKLNLPQDRIPQLEEVSCVLREATGWQCQQVPALIGFGEFFRLLSEKKFPVATFIRREEDFDYLQEPDIFHEIFGHCPLLTNPAFANFTQMYGKLGLNASKQDRVFLARLYWFTIEFGLLNTEDGLRIYGGGILSSPGETQYAMHDENVIRKPLDVVDVFRTPYRIDIMQPVYFMLEQIKQLDDIAELDLLALLEEAKAMGMHEPLFPPKDVKIAS